MSKLGLHIIGLALISTPLAATGQHARVAPEGYALTKSVSYTDLNLSSNAGRETLRVRVTRAASAVCRPHGYNALSQGLAERRCRSTALSNARREMDQAIARAAIRQASRNGVFAAVR